MIEAETDAEDARVREVSWRQWLPEIEATFKDRMLDLMGDRIKLEALTQFAHAKGATSPYEVVKLISDMAPHAQRKFPKWHFLDALYKYMSYHSG